jgi:hypothetical protein
MSTPNRPNFNRRVGKTDPGHRIVIRLRGETDEKRVEDLLEDKWIGTTRIVPPGREHADSIHYTQEANMKNEVTLSHADFLKLYRAYCDQTSVSNSLAVSLLANAYQKMTVTQKSLLILGAEDTPLLKLAIERATAQTEPRVQLTQQTPKKEPEDPGQDASTEDSSPYKPRPLSKKRPRKDKQ